jgi:hypothetical protein
MTEGSPGSMVNGMRGQGAVEQAFPRRMKSGWRIPVLHAASLAATQDVQAELFCGLEASMTQMWSRLEDSLKQLTTSGSRVASLSPFQRPPPNRRPRYVYSLGLSQAVPLQWAPGHSSNPARVACDNQTHPSSLSYSPAHACVRSPLLFTLTLVHNSRSFASSSVRLGPRSLRVSRVLVIASPPALYTYIPLVGDFHSRTYRCRLILRYFGCIRSAAALAWSPRLTRPIRISWRPSTPPPTSTEPALRLPTALVSPSRPIYQSEPVTTHAHIITTIEEKA